MFVSVVFKYIHVWHCIPDSQTLTHTVKHRGQDYLLVESDSVKFPLIKHFWFGVRKLHLIPGKMLCSPGGYYHDV